MTSMQTWLDENRGSYITVEETERLIEQAIERNAATQHLDEIMTKFAATRTLVRLTSSEVRKAELLGTFLFWMRDDMGVRIEHDCTTPHTEADA
jgi:hypothetical protein